MKDKSGLKLIEICEIICAFVMLAARLMQIALKRCVYEETKAPVTRDSDARLTKDN